MITTQASEIGQLSAAAITEIIERATAGNPVAAYVEGEPLAWSVVQDGGWDLIGAPESEAGGDASLRDLVEVAQAWGRGCIPLPLLETLWVKRWSAAAREHGGPISVSVPRLGTTDGSGLAPFGSLPGVAVARSVGSAVDVVDPAPSGSAEGFAQSLRSAILPWTSEISSDAALELGVVWAAEAVGSAQLLLDLSVKYAKEREQFGKPIGSFQAVKHRLADMHSQAQYAQTAVIWASLEPENAIRASRYALDTAIAVAESSIQVHGGMGFTWEVGLHFYLRSILTRRELVHGLWG